MLDLARILHRLGAAARRGGHSFAATTLALFVVATLVPLGLALVQTRSDQQAARAQAQLNAEASAYVAAQDVNDLLDLIRASAATATRLDGFWTGSDTDRDRILTALAQPQPHVNALVFYTVDLEQHGSSNQDGQAQRPNARGRGYAHEALASGDLAVTAQPLRSLAPPYTPVLPVAVPVHGPSSSQTGLIVAGLKLDRLPTIWDDVSVPAGSAILLVDVRTGLVLATNSSALDRIGTQLTAPELQQVDTEPQVDGLDQQDTLLRAAPVEGLPWRVLVEVPAASVVGPLSAAATLRAVTSAGLAVVSLVLLVLLWRTIGARLDRLQRAASAWGQGNLAHRVGLRSADELGQLGAAFDHMADELQLALSQRDAALARALAGEQQNRMLLDQASDAILVSDGIGRYLDVNAQASALLGYSRHELLHMTLHDLVPPDAPAPKPRLPVDMAEGDIIRVERRVRRKDGTVVPVEVSARLLSDGRLQAIVRDITERERAEADHRKHIQQLADIIQVQTDITRTELQPARLMELMVNRVQVLTGTSGAVIELLDGDEMVYAAVGGSVALHTGLRLRAEGSFSGLCARTGRVLVSADTESDPRVNVAACRAVGARSMVVAPLEDEQRVVGVLKVVSPQPGAFDEHHVATLELLAGLLGAALGHAQAFAERAAAEAKARAAAERLSAVLSAATECAIVGIDLEGRVTFFSRGAEQMLGYTAGELIGQFPSMLLDLDEIKARAAEQGITPMEWFVGAAREGGAHTDECTYVRKDGARLTVSVSVTGMRDTDGTLLGFVSVGTDVTARRAVEKMKDEFVSVVSHELRTPLTSIRGSLGLVAGGVFGRLPQQAERMLTIATRNTDRLLRLINDMLDLERMASGRSTMQPVTCELDQLMQQAAEVMRNLAESSAVRLHVEPLAASIHADPDRVIQVLTNLISNAVKFSDGGREVWMTARQPTPGTIRIEVRDQGRGIPAEHLERIFERFQQVDSSDSRDKGGTGLGLAICRSIVEQHGGRIWAESTPGSGTTMIVELPSGARASEPATHLEPSRAPISPLAPAA